MVTHCAVDNPECSKAVCSMLSYSGPVLGVLWKLSQERETVAKDRQVCVPEPYSRLRFHMESRCEQGTSVWKKQETQI